MRKTILDIREMSDSKEVYGQRPNPFIIGFIYCLVALLIITLVYSFFGKIEVVSTATGVIRPNDDISTVSSLISGKITGVHYSNGQIVEAGDPLLTIDTSESEIILNSLLETQQEYQHQANMMEKFLDGIENGSNPFSPDSGSDEYPYYVQYRDYELSLLHTQQNIAYDIDNTNANIQLLEEQIAQLQYQINGMNSYKNSVEQGKNLAVQYPEYSKMYVLYLESMKTLTNEYNSQRVNIMSDTSMETSQQYLEIYQEQLADYNNLVSSIQHERSEFPNGNGSIGKMLYDDYVNNLEEYKRNYQSARDTYEYYLNSGNTSQEMEKLLAYEQTMLEGYNYYLNSVISGSDQFVEGRDSIYYRSLYIEYKAKYDLLVEETTAPQETYSGLGQASVIMDNEGSIANTVVSESGVKQEQFKSATIASIKNQIRQLEASIAEKKISMDGTASDYNITIAKTKMESAQAAIETYKNSKLLEYRQIQTDLNNKISELTLNVSTATSKDTLIKALDKSYQDSMTQKQYQAMTQADTTIQSSQAELTAARSNLRLSQITAKLYQNNKDQNGDPISISIATVEQISTILNNLDNINAQLSETDTRIRQTEEQISYGTIKAEQSGVINETATVVRGDAISSGMTFATIIPMNESEHKVQMYVSSSDIANIKVGDMIKYNISALPSSQYGTVSGTVLSIAKDALVQDGQYSGYFLVEGSIANDALVDKDDNIGTISIGMQTAAKIVTQEKSIFRYLLEKINLF